MCNEVIKLPNLGRWPRKWNRMIWCLWMWTGSQSFMVHYIGVVADGVGNCGHDQEFNHCSLYPTLIYDIHQVITFRGVCRKEHATGHLQPIYWLYQIWKSAEALPSLFQTFSDLHSFFAYWGAHTHCTEYCIDCMFGPKKRIGEPLSGSVWGFLLHRDQPAPKRDWHPEHHP